MDKPFSISPSSIKTFVSSKAKWAGKYILGIKDDEDNKDALYLGKMFEEWLFTGKDNRDIITGIEIEDKQQFIDDLETLKYNSEGLDFKVGEAQVLVSGELFGCNCIGYIDNLTDIIEDIKTIRFPSQENGPINSWSGMSYRDEYALQLWIYMKLKGINKSRIVEVSKHRYKDGRKANQIIEFELTPEFDNKMTNRYGPIIKEMEKLYKTHKKFDI